MTFAANSAAEGATQSVTITATDDDAVGEGRVVHGDAGYDHLDAVVPGLPQVWRVQLCHGDDIAESDPITVSISGPSTVDEGDAATSAYTVSLSPVGSHADREDLTVSIRHR